jgi:hypothetical protein
VSLRDSLSLGKPRGRSKRGVQTSGTFAFTSPLPHPTNRRWPRSFLRSPRRCALSGIRLDGDEGPRYLLRNEAGVLVGLYPFGAEPMRLYAVPLRPVRDNPNPFARFDSSTRTDAVGRRCPNAFSSVSGTPLFCVSIPFGTLAQPLSALCHRLRQASFRRRGRPNSRRLQAVTRRPPLSIGESRPRSAIAFSGTEHRSLCFGPALLPGAARNSRL